MPALAEDSLAVQWAAITLPPLVFWLWVCWLEAWGVWETEIEAVLPPPRPSAQIIDLETERARRRGRA